MNFYSNQRETQKNIVRRMFPYDIKMKGVHAHL